MTSRPERTPIAAVASLEGPAAIRVEGRVIDARDGAFEVRDATASITVRGAGVSAGDLVVVEGTLDEARVLVATRVDVVGRPRRPFPDPHGDFVRLHTKGRIARLRARHDANRAVRAFFDARDYVEVETPTVVPSPGLDVHLAAFAVEGFGAPRFLSTSPEYQMKRLLSAGMPRIVQIARCYRRDEAGIHHEPEFTMVEWYHAFADAETVMRETESLVEHVVRTLNGGDAHVARPHGRVDVSAPWERITVADAYARYAGVTLDDVLPDEDRFFALMVERIQPELGRTKATFLTEWPIAMASLARPTPHDPRFAERFEAFVDGIELCNGFGELTDPVEQRRRFEADRDERRARGLPVYPIDERFLAALDEGMPPAGGNALGFDRLVLLATGARSLEDVLAIPSREL